MQETKLIKTFENTEFGKVRVIVIDNIPWFVGKDVCAVLGYENSSRDINRHVDETQRSAANLHGRKF